MLITFDRIIANGLSCSVCIHRVEKLNCHQNAISYWKIGDSKHMFRLSLDTIFNVRIFENENEYTRSRESQVM